MQQVTSEEQPIKGQGGAGVPPEIAQFGGVKAQPFTQEHLDKPYTTYTIDTRYEFDTGLRVLPVSGPGLPAVQVRVAPPMWVKTVQFTAERMGGQPDAPDPDTGDPNEVLIDGNFYPANPLQTLDQKVWRASGYYVYALLNPKSFATSKFPCGTTPAEEARSSDHYYDARNFKKNIIDATFAREAPPRLRD